MHQRCKNPKVPNYKSYGGRGITVCERWSTFANFVEDMGEKPTPLHSLDRIDNNGNYEPSNCRWATRHEQMANMQHALPITGVSKYQNGWRARMRVNGTTLQKLFPTKEQAILQRKEWENNL